MDGNTSEHGYHYSKLQWSFLPCKDAPQVVDQPLCGLWNTPQGNYGAGAPGGAPGVGGCGVRGSNPYLASCGKKSSVGGEVTDYGYVPGKPLGEVIGSPFESTECTPELVVPPVLKAPLMKPCGDDGCQALYEKRAGCKRRTGEVRRFWESNPCLCQDTRGDGNFGDCAGSGTTKGCICSPAGCAGPRLPNYRQMLKSSAYPFC